MKQFKKRVLLCILGLAFILGFNFVISTPIYADENNYMDIKIFDKTQKLNMPRNTISYWFSIPDGAEIDDKCYLNLDMKLSETLIYERSSITLIVNETTLDTKWILDLQKDDKCNWKISIPKDVIKIGELNELKIITAQRSIEGDCQDIDNPSNWVNFLKTSYLHLAIKSYADPKINDFYYYYFNNLLEKSLIENEFVLPDKCSNEELAGMLQVASAIGENYPFNDRISYTIRKESDNNITEKNKIYIGHVDSFKKENIKSVPDNLTDKTGYISVEGKKKDANYYKTIITGADQTGLQKALEFFSNKEFLSGIDRDKMKVTSDISDRTKISSEIFNETGFYKFSDYGYKSTNLAGAFHQSTNFQFDQPGGIKCGEDSYILIRFRHSKSLVADNSLMTVYFDDVAAGSIKLSASNADYGELKVKIPEKYRNEKTIYVTVDCYNYLGKIDCSKDYYDTAWTVIDESSDIYFEIGDKGISPNLLDTVNFYRNGERNQILVSLPQKYTNKELTTATVLSTRASQNSKEYAKFTVCTNPTEISGQNLQKDMIFIGSNETIQLPDEIGEELVILPKNSSTFRINSQVMESAETLLDKVVVQVIRSPWNFEKRVYVITYDKSMEDKLVEIFSNKDILKQLNNQISVINYEGKVTNHTLKTEKEKDRKVPLNWERIKYLVETGTGFSIYMVITSIVLIIIAIIVLIKVIRNKKRFKQAAKKMKGLNEKEMDTANNEDEKIVDNNSEESFEYGDGEEEE